MSLWEAESIRVSLFSSAETRVTDADWETLAGQTDDYNRQAVAGSFVYSGKFEDSQLSVSGINRRVDIVQSPAIPPELPASFPTVGPWEAARDRFVKVTSDWIGDASFPIIRIAFGAVLLCRTETREDAYDLLSDLLSSVSVDTERMRELSYRVNWPAQSGVVQGLILNRITNWTALSFRFANVQLGSSQTVNTTPFSYAARLELDHSTDQERSEPFDKVQVLALLSELVELASQNANLGERP